MIRSLLFIPGNSPSMLINADIHSADAVIFDLEDAVAPDQKDAARILVRNAIRQMDYQGFEMVVRVNPLLSGYMMEDLREIVPLKPYALLAPKVGTAQAAREISEAIARIEAEHGIETGSVRLMTLLETAEGIENAYAIASSDPRVCGVLLGAEDLTSDLTANRTKLGAEIAYSRGRVVVAARAALVDCYDTPFTDVNDDEGALHDALHARALGFTGKAAISPRHVSDINRAFSPSPEEVAYAEDVMAAIEEAKRMFKGAVSLRGKMIDKPVVDRARRVLELQKLLGGTRHE